MIVIAAKTKKKNALWRQALAPTYSLASQDLPTLQALTVWLKQNSAQLILLHCNLLGKKGMDEIAEIVESQENLKLILLTEQYQQRQEISAVLFGAKAYIQDDIDLLLLHKIINTVLSGELWVDRKFVGRLLDEMESLAKTRHDEAQSLSKGIEVLTEREAQIAKLVAKGASNRRIAEQLFISERTVKAHLSMVFKKIGIHDRLQLALYMTRYQQLTEIWQPKK